MAIVCWPIYSNMIYWQIKKNQCKRLYLYIFILCKKKVHGSRLQSGKVAACKYKQAQLPPRTYQKVPGTLRNFRWPWTLPHKLVHRPNRKRMYVPSLCIWWFQSLWDPPTVLWVRTQPKSEIPLQSQLKLIEFYKPGTTLGATSTSSHFISINQQPPYPDQQPTMPCTTNTFLMNVCWVVSASQLKIGAGRAII